MKLRYTLLALLGLGGYVVHAQQGLPTPTLEKSAATTLGKTADTRLDTGFEEATETSISGSHLQPVHSATHARTGETSLLLAGGGDRAYFSLSRLLPAKANQRITASLYASYSAQSHSVDRILQAAGVAAAAYSQVQPAQAPEQPSATGKRTMPYLGVGLAVTPGLRSLHHRAPKAYLRYTIYNADTVLVASASRSVDRTARNNWQELSLAWTMPTDGFVQLSFVNESPEPVRVDDFSLLIAAETLTPAPVAAHKFKGAIANNFGTQTNGKCLGEVVIVTPPYCEVYPDQCESPPEPPPYFPPYYPPYDPGPDEPPYPDYPDGGGDSPGGGSGPASPTTIFVDPNVPTCVQAVIGLVKNAANGNGVASIFNFLSVNKNVDLDIQMGNIGTPNGTQTNANTSQIQGAPSNFLLITIDNGFGANATDVAIARTLIHESLHAYLMLWGYDQNLNLNSTTSQLVQAYAVAQAGAANIAAQHDAIATMVNQMAAYLTTMFPYLPADYAKNLFWAGLTGTDAYAALSDSQKAAITAANNAELFSSPSAQGTKACN